MTIRTADDGMLVLEGVCPVEDAEALLQQLLSRPAATIDWTKCSHLHTAVLQVILASGRIPSSACGDPFLNHWLPQLLQNR